MIPKPIKLTSNTDIYGPHDGPGADDETLDFCREESASLWSTAFSRERDGMVWGTVTTSALGAGGLDIYR